MERKQKGFSLIELLIVVAIILIIAAIAIPNLIRSKMAANEASAVASMRSVNTACVSYSSTYGIGFPTNLSNLGPVAAGTNATSTSADLIDSVLSSGTKSGYSFTYAMANSGATYSLTAADGAEHDRYALLLHRPVRCDPLQRRRRCRREQHAAQQLTVIACRDPCRRGSKTPRLRPRRQRVAGPWFLPRPSTRSGEESFPARV